MKTKNKIGILFVLGGIALLGVYYFKKNKPTIASSQKKGLEALSNYYETGVGAREETFIPKGTGYVNPNLGNISLAQIDFTNLTPKQEEDIKKAVGNIVDPTTSIADQIAKNLANKDFSNISTNWEIYDFSNVKLP